MLKWEDVHFQLVDLPAISNVHPLPWLGSTLQSADACLLVVDLGDPDCLEQVAAVQEDLKQRKVSLVTAWPGDAAAAGEDAADAADEGDLFALRLPTLLVANKADLLAHADTDLAALAELEEPHFPTLLVSAETGQGLGDLGPWLWQALGLVRIYTKTPGKPALHDRPFTLRRGEQTVGGVARLVHREMAKSLKYARVWGRSVVAEGQHVGRDHVLADRDVVELHT
jgi:ribosome-interacting GTPase 1